MITRRDLELTLANNGVVDCVTIYHVSATAVTERTYVRQEDTWCAYVGKGPQQYQVGQLLPGRDQIYTKLTGKHAEKHGKVFLTRRAAVDALRKDVETRMRGLRGELARCEQLLADHPLEAGAA